MWQISVRFYKNTWNALLIFIYKPNTVVWLTKQRQHYIVCTEALIISEISMAWSTGMDPLLGMTMCGSQILFFEHPSFLSCHTTFPWWFGYFQRATGSCPLSCSLHTRVVCRVLRVGRPPAASPVHPCSSHLISFYILRVRGAWSSLGAMYPNHISTQANP